MVVFLMCGNPATGKTTLAKNLHCHMQKTWEAKLVTSLEFRKKFNLFNLSSENERNEIYRILAGQVQDIIKQNKHRLLVVDANFNKRERRELLYHASTGCILCVIECVVSDEKVIKQRLHHRNCNQEISENKASTWEIYTFIKENSDPVEKDEQITSGRIGLIRFDSACNNSLVVQGVSENPEQELFDSLLLFLSNYPNMHSPKSNQEKVPL